VAAVVDAGVAVVAPTVRAPARRAVVRERPDAGRRPIETLIERGTPF
jgi:hypothetical protein